MSVRRPSDRGVVFLLAALTMIGPFTVDTIFPGFPAVQREFAVDAVATQQIVSVYLFTFAVMSLLHGPLSDALGRKPIIVGGLALFTATSVFCALAPSMTWLLVGRALQGVVAGGGMIVGRTVVRDLFSGDTAQRAMSQMSMIFGVAPALAPIVGGWLLGWSSWRSIFWFLALFAVAILAAVLLFLPETHPADRRTSLQPGALVRAVVDAGRDAGVRRLLAVSSFNFAALFTYISAAPAIIVDHLHLGPGDFGWLFVPVVTMMIFGSWLTGRLAGRVSGPRFLTLVLAWPWSADWSISARRRRRADPAVGARGTGDHRFGHRPGLPHRHLGPARCSAPTPRDVVLDAVLHQHDAQLGGGGSLGAAGQRDPRRIDRCRGEFQRGRMDHLGLPPSGRPPPGAHSPDPGVLRADRPPLTELLS
ncbi:MAG: multidrug effflux MFS transporter [Actinomycetales bacterium]|nr:multidrug effflux MFS transporter [Candidatus Phosphoribacter baldrii]